MRNRSHRIASARVQSEGKLNGMEVRHSKWADEVIVDYAIRFIEKHQNGPFFAYLPSMTCHSPLAAPEAVVRKYKKKELSLALATLYAMVDFFDQQIQRLFDQVESPGLSENTVIFFMSGNGPAINNRGLTDEERRIRYHSQLKGHLRDYSG